MNYEVENALRRKTDDWEFNALRQKVDHLESENRQLQEKLGHAEGRLSNHYSALERLIQIMVDSGQFVETNQLYEIRQYL